MKRRTFALLASTSLVAFRTRYASAQTARDASLLTTTLTPMGAERAGNADGTIPAWTGGVTTVPAGWKPGTFMPDIYAEDKMIVKIDSSNMAQYTDKFSEGVLALMSKYGYSAQIYPTHRSASAPQWVYDNIAKNAVNGKLSPTGGRFGFEGAYGGVPFPIPDISDPLAAGAQIIWNHNCRWQGWQWLDTASSSWSVSNGHLAIGYQNTTTYALPYYDPAGTLETFNGILFKVLASPYAQPANLVGEEVIFWEFASPAKNATQTWEVLNGQGRVRKAPEDAFDTPSSFQNGILNYDESYGFNGSPERYDWKYLGKKEMYIPCNNNDLYALTAREAHLQHFIEPTAVRWELHRVWVIEATLHPGERNVMARRRYYVDEDTWTISMGDTYDQNNVLYHVGVSFLNLRPDLPGLVYGNGFLSNMQTGDFASNTGSWNQKAKPTQEFLTQNLPNSTWDPQSMAASAQY